MFIVLEKGQQCAKKNDMNGKCLKREVIIVYLDTSSFLLFTYYIMKTMSPYLSVNDERNDERCILYELYVGKTNYHYICLSSSCE